MVLVPNGRSRARRRGAFADGCEAAVSDEEDVGSAAFEDKFRLLVVLVVLGFDFDGVGACIKGAAAAAAVLVVHGTLKRAAWQLCVDGPKPPRERLIICGGGGMNVWVMRN
jgi:hypothetical protein